MSSTQAPSIRQILDTPDLDERTDLDDPDQIQNLILGDGEGGEGVSYHTSEADGDIGFTKIEGWWILKHGTHRGEYGSDGRQVWHFDFTPYATYREGRAAYIAEIERMQAEGVAWEPDVCPIWDRLEAAWK